MKKKIKNLIFIRKKLIKGNNSFTFTAIFSLVIISFSFILPSTVNFFEKNIKKNKSITASSKILLDEQINKKVTKEKGLSEKNFSIEQIFADIDFFRSDDDIDNTTTLSASTIEQLFEDTNYDLKKVRDTKLVNIGNSIDHLPKEIKNIENVQKRKKLFIQIVLPLIIEENTKIALDRKKLFELLNKSSNSQRDKKWLNKKFKQYGVKNKDFSILKIRMDIIPVSLAIAQAAKETGWGTSRFAQEGNALFGQWTWNGDGIKPADVSSDAKHKVAKFKILRASVRAYQRNLNTHSSYIKFRNERAIQRDNNEKLNSLTLLKYLDSYAATGIEYTKVLEKIILQNSLLDFDDVKILPTSKKLKSLI